MNILEVHGWCLSQNVKMLLARQVVVFLGMVLTSKSNMELIILLFSESDYVLNFSGNKEELEKNFLF